MPRIRKSKPSHATMRNQPPSTKPRVMRVMPNKGRIMLIEYNNETGFVVNSAFVLNMRSELLTLSCCHVCSNRIYSGNGPTSGFKYSMQAEVTNVPEGVM